MFISSCYFVLLVCFAPQMHPFSQFDKTVLSKTVFVIIYIYFPNDLGGLQCRCQTSPLKVPGPIDVPTTPLDPWALRLEGPKQ